MSFDNVGDFLYMGGHYMEVWLSYALGLGVVTAIVVRPIVARRRFFAQERRRIERERVSSTTTGENGASRAS